MVTQYLRTTSTSTGISNTLPQKVSPKSVCQPQKKYKQEGDNDITVVTSANETWLQAGSHKLTLYDKMTLINENELSDHHINFAHTYCLINFLPYKGFQINPFAGEAPYC